MKEKMKRIGKSLLSLTLAFSMVFSILMLPDIVHINDTKEASAKTYSFDVTSGTVDSSELKSGLDVMVKNKVYYKIGDKGKIQTSKGFWIPAYLDDWNKQYYRYYAYDSKREMLTSIFSDNNIYYSQVSSLCNKAGASFTIDDTTSSVKGLEKIYIDMLKSSNDVGQYFFDSNKNNYFRLNPTIFDKRIINVGGDRYGTIKSDNDIYPIFRPSKNKESNNSGRYVLTTKIDKAIKFSYYSSLSAYYAYYAYTHLTDNDINNSYNNPFMIDQDVFYYDNTDHNSQYYYRLGWLVNSNAATSLVGVIGNDENPNFSPAITYDLHGLTFIPSKNTVSPSMTDLLNQNIKIEDTANDASKLGILYVDSTNAARNSLTAPSISGKNINRAAKGITYTFDVKGVNVNQEHSGDKKYVSAIIYDKNKNPIYYGRLAQVNNLAQKVGTVNSSSTNSAGTTVKEQTRDMSVNMTIPNDLYENEKYLVAVFEETEASDGTRTMSSPEYANLTVSGIENIYAENAAMSGSNKGKSTEKHNNTSTEPVSDTSLVSDTKTYYDDQTITDKSNWIVEENVVNAKDVGGSVIRQEVLGANDYYVMDYDNWEYYAVYLYVKDHTSEQTKYSYKIDANGNVINDTAAVNYTQCGNDKQRKTWLKLVAAEYRKSGLIKTMTNNWVPKEADMKAFDSSALGLNCLNTVHIPKLADGVTKGTKDIIFLRFHNYNGTPTFFSYKKTLQIKTQATNDTDEKTIIEADKWHTWTDSKGIEWTYMINKDGEVIYLYTKDATAMDKLIVSGAHDEESYDLPENDILMIPDSINGLPVVGIGGGTKDTPLFPYITTVKDPLTAGEGVTVADSFDSITFPASVRKINDYAFYESTAGYNYQISENDDGNETATAKATGTITIPNTVKEIGNYAFYQMPYITDITIDSDGMSIDYRAFANCDRIESVRVINSDNKGAIGERAFADNNKTRYIVVSGNVDIKARAFANNANLGKYNKKLSYGLNIDSMTGTIGFEAFADDVNLTSLYVPNTVTMEESVDKEHGYQFRGCTALKEVEYDSEKLGNNVFNGCGAITDLILGDTVKTVEASWGGSVSGKAVNRTIYVKSATTKFGFTKNGSSYSSGFGYQSGVNSGTVTVRYKEADNADIPLTDAVSGNMSSIEKKKDSDVKPHFTANGACTISFVLVGDSENVTDKDLHSQATMKGIEVTLKKGIYENSTVKKTQFIVKPEMSDSSSTDTAYDDYYMMSEDDWKAVQAAADTKRISLATKENFETAAKDAKVSADRFTTDKLVDDSTAAFVNVVFIRYADEAGKNGYFIKKLTIPYSKLTDEAAKDQVLDSIGVSSYTELAEKVTELTDEVTYWREQVKELSGMADDATADVETMKAAMQKAQKELADYTVMYNALVEQMKQLTTSMDNNNGYFVNKTTENGIVKVIYINGKELTYTEAGTDSDGHKLYESTGDVDGDGVDEKLVYWVDENGVHVVKKNDKAPETDLVYKDDIAALQRRLTVQLTSMQSDLNSANDLLKKIDAKIKQIMKALGIEDTDGTEDEQLTLIYDKVVAMNQKILSYQNVIKSIYKQLASEDLTDEQLNDINTVLTSITDKISKLQQANKDLTDEVKDKDKKITELNGKLTESQTTVDGLQKEIEKMKAEAATMQETITSQANTLKETQNKVNSLTSSNEELSNEITSLNGNIDALKSNNEKQSEQIETLQTTLSSKDEQIANNTATIEELQGVIAQAKIEADALKSTNASQADTIKALEENVANLTAIKDEQAETISGLQENVTTLTSQNTSLSENVATLTATVKEQETKIAELKEQLAAQKELVEQLQAESSQYLLTTGEAIDMFGFDSSMSKEDMKTAITSFVNAKITLGKIQSAFNTDKDGEELVAFLQTNAGGVTPAPTPTTPSGDVDKASYDKGYQAGYAAGVTDGKKQSSSTGTIPSNVSSSSSSSTEVTTLEKQVNTLKTENKALTTQVNTLSTGIDELYDSLSDGLVGASAFDDAVSKLDTVKSAVTSMEKSNKTLDKKNTSLNKKVTSLTSTNKKLKTTNSSLSKKNKSLFDKNKSLTSTNKQLVATNNTLQASLQSARNTASQQVASVPASKGTAIESQSNTKDDTKKQESKTSEEKKDTVDNSPSSSTSPSQSDSSVNLPSLDDKVKDTTPIYPTPEVSTEQSGTETPDNTIPGLEEDTEGNGNNDGSNKKIREDIVEDTDSSLPIGPIVFGVIIIVGVSVLLITKKKKKAADDIDEI